jgi:hypothetical protein
MTNEVVISITLPKINDYGLVKVHPQAILDKKITKKGNKVATMVLIQWTNLFKEDTTWKELDELIKQFSTFNVNYKG